MYALLAKGIKVDWQGGDKGFSFTGLHFSDSAVVQDHATNQLNIEMALV